LFGPPNAGKSSLFNALVGHTRALVSPVPGTTRDPVDATLDLGGAKLLLRDLSGVGSSDADAGRFNESAREAALAADLLLLVCGPGDEPELSQAFRALCDTDSDLRARSLWVQTKSDLGLHQAPPAGMEVVSVSAVAGSGIAELRHRLHLAVSELAGAGLQTMLGQRAAEAFARLAPHVADAETPPEATAADVRVALRLLDEALLSDAPGDVLDLIFSQFCIGK
jgi:tRNA modification GTPase